MSVSPESVEGRREEVEGQALPSNQESTISVFIDEKPYVALLDSGSTHTLIRQESVPRDVTFSDKVKIWCVHSDNED